MLLEKTPGQLLDHLAKIFPGLLGALSDKSDRVVQADLAVLAQISRRVPPQQFN